MYRKTVFEPKNTTLKKEIVWERSIIPENIFTLGQSCNFLIVVEQMAECTLTISSNKWGVPQVIFFGNI